MSKGLTVFLCSTFEDLSDERQQVTEAIQKLQLQYDSMEFFGARSGLSIDTCLEEVRRSDILVVIVGHRYGTLVQNLGLSYSQAEYEEGYKLKKPCLVYFRDENVPVLPRFIERDPENLSRLEKWKRILVSRHTVASFIDSLDLAVRVTADLARTAQSLEEARQDTFKTENERVVELSRIVEDAIANGLDQKTILSSLRLTIGRMIKRAKNSPTTIFLSHSHKDNEIVRKFAKGLTESGFRVWFDEAELKVGDNLRDKIEYGLDTADYIAFFLSQNSLHSKWFNKELNSALSRQIEGGGGATILPVIIEDVELPPILRSFVYLEIKNRNINNAVNKFIDAITTRREADAREYTVQVNNTSDHPKGIRVYLTISVTDHTSIDKVINTLIQYPELIEVTNTYGQIDIIAILKVVDIYSIQGIVQKIFSVEGIHSVQTFVEASPPRFFNPEI